MQAKVAKLDSFFDLQKCQLAKINYREIFNIDDLRLLIPAKFQEFMNHQYWSFCPIQFLFKLGHLKTIDYFVIFGSKK